MVREDNEVRLRGRLTRDPEYKEDIGVVNFSIAIDNSGREDKETVAGFFDITFWTRESDYSPVSDVRYVKKHLSENTLRKGTLVSVRGRLNQDRFLTKDDKKASRIGVVADSISVLHNPEVKTEETPAAERMDASSF